MKKSVETVLVGVLVLAGAGGTAFAQEQDRVVVRRNFDRQLGQHAQPEGGNTFTMNMTEIDGEHSYTLSLKNGEASASMDNKDVPKDRLRRRGSSYEILDEKGEVVHTFRVIGMDGGRGGRMWLQGRAPEPEGQAMPTRRPRVMIGINMSDAEGGGVTVDNVVEGLPASKGGLMEKDRIVKMDDKAIETTGDVRDVLRGKDDGDEVRVVVRRGEEEKTITVKLESFNAERLGVPMLLDVPMVAEGQILGQGQGDWYEEARRAWEMALAEIKKHGEAGGDQLMQEVDKAWRDAMKAMAEAKSKTRQWWNDQGKERLFTDQDRFVIPAPPAPSAPQAVRGSSLDRQLDRLTEQLDRLQRRLDEMEKRMESGKKGE